MTEKRRIGFEGVTDLLSEFVFRSLFRPDDDREKILYYGCFPFRFYIDFVSVQQVLSQ